MPITTLQREQQTRLFAKRQYQAAKDAKAITKNTERLLNEAIKNGASPNDLKKLLAGEAKKAANYAKTAARTDATRIENQARNDLYGYSAEFLDKYDVLVIKIWNAIIDKVTRASHSLISGEEQIQDDTFSNGGEHPGDPDLPPEELYNCRCYLTTRIEGLQYMSNAEKNEVITQLQELSKSILERVV